MRRTARHFYVVLLFFCVPISADALLAQDASSSPGPAETVVNLINAVHEGDGELMRDYDVTGDYPDLLADAPSGESDIEIRLETVFENGVAHSAYAFNNRMGRDVISPSYAFHAQVIVRVGVRTLITFLARNVDGKYKVVGWRNWF